MYSGYLKMMVGVIVLVPLAMGCSSTDGGFVVTESRFMMGTVVEITVVHPDTAAAKVAIGLAYDEMDRVENMTTSYSDTNAVARLNAGASKRMGPPVDVSEELYGILMTAEFISHQTKGAFDITIGPLVKAWSFNDAGHVPHHESIRAAVDRVDFKKLWLSGDSYSALSRKEGMLVDPGELTSAGFLQEGMLVDLSGIAKGYAADEALRILRGRGISNALVNAWGDVALLGTGISGKGWRIGLKHPREEGFYLRLLLEQGAAATSGDYERFFMDGNDRMHHILDPRTGFPAKPCVSVTVLAADAMAADAYATGLFVMGPVNGLELAESTDDIEALFIYANGDFLVEVSSSGFDSYVMEQ